MSSASFNRPGAVDLSQLAAKAQQNAAPGASGGRGGASYVVETTQQTFEADVVRRSLTHPVVVELYSPRVQTGQQLSDALAELATEAAGKYLVARLNVDTAPQLVQQLGIQAVPTVIAVIGGQLAPLFQGVVPKDQVRAVLDELVKAAVANGIVGRADPVAGGAADAEADDEPDPRFAAADAALEQGDFDTALAEFDRLLAANPADAEAKAGRAQVGLLARASRLDPQAVRAAAVPGAPLQAQLDAADLELVSGDAEAAFERLVTVVRTSAGSDRDTARVRLLELFETLGNGDDRVLKARRALMSALF